MDETYKYQCRVWHQAQPADPQIKILSIPMILCDPFSTEKLYSNLPLLLTNFVVAADKATLQIVLASY